MSIHAFAVIIFLVSCGRKRRIRFIGFAETKTVEIGDISLNLVLKQWENLRFLFCLLIRT